MTGDDNGVSVDTQSAKGRSRENPCRCWLRRRGVDFRTLSRGEPPRGGGRRQKRATGARASISIEKARAASRLPALTGEERI
jgi:hypothetical protein